MLRSSVVLSCYNGSKYVIEQLDSLRCQSRSLDEVLISDDFSSDNTPKIISGYIVDHGLRNWHLSRNSANKGWKRNFHELIRNASGDLIFLSDQDDIWMTNKVESMAVIMEEHPDIDVLACSVEPFYESGSQKVTGQNSMAGLGSGNIIYQHIDDKSVYVQRPGCSYCIRRNFAKQIEPYWDDSWAHDAVLWVLSEAKGSLVLYDKRLVHFRRHEGNASARKRMTQTDRVRDLKHLSERVELMELFGDDCASLSANDRATLEDTRRWLESRIRFLETPSLSSLGEVISGRRHYLTSKGLPVDILLGFFHGVSL